MVSPNRDIHLILPSHPERRSGNHMIRLCHIRNVIAEYRKEMAGRPPE